MDEKIYAHTFFILKMGIRALSSHAENRKSFCTKVYPLFKNGQKKCPKTKTQNTFAQKYFTFLPCDFKYLYNCIWKYITVYAVRI
jgi:hypothetical protein